MAARVFLHIGLPKTATTYLQTIAWANRDVLADQQVRLPGRDRRDHYWASRLVREDPAFRKFGEPHRSAWQRVRADIEAWPGTALVSHEFFAAASAEQAARMVADLAPAEVHLVVTGREPLGLFTASWQESLKNRETNTMADYSRTESADTTAIWNWRTLDIRLVLERWTPSFAPEHVHVLPLPGRDAPKREIWDRFATLVGIDPDSVDLGRSFPNASMGVVEAETLRRLNHHLGAFNSAIDRATYIRTFLADERLVPRGGEPYWPTPDRVEEARQRGREAVDHIAVQGYDVVGDLDALLVPAVLPERRVPESVTDAEVADVAIELAARMLEDVRELRHERRDLRAQLRVQAWRAANPPLRAALVKRFPRLSRVVQVGPPQDPPPGWSPQREPQ
jgi:hypothetical protein